MDRVFGWRIGAALVVVLLVASACAAGAAAASASDSSPAPATTQAAVVPSSVATRSPAAAAADIPFKLKAYPFKLRELPIEGRPLSTDWVTPREDAALHDADGVRMQIIDGKTSEWPRGQANYGLENLNSYRLTGDQFFLDRCLAQAERIASYRVEADDGGLVLPQLPVSLPARQARRVDTRPVLLGACRGPHPAAVLAPRAADRPAEWRDAADHTFAAFLRRGRRDDGPVCRGRRRRRLLLAAGVAVGGHGTGLHPQRPQLVVLRRVRVLHPDP